MDSSLSGRPYGHEKTICAGEVAASSSRKHLEAGKQPGRDGSFHDSGRNAGVGQGLNHSGVGSFHEIRQHELTYEAVGTVSSRWPLESVQQVKSQLHSR